MEITHTFTAQGLIYPHTTQIHYRDYGLVEVEEWREGFCDPSRMLLVRATVPTRC
jgi:hypothetical protein